MRAALAFFGLEIEPLNWEALHNHPHTNVSLSCKVYLPLKGMSSPQVRDDFLTKSSNVQTIFDNIPVKDKKLFWIEAACLKLALCGNHHRLRIGVPLRDQMSRAFI